MLGTEHCAVLCFAGKEIVKGKLEQELDQISGLDGNIGLGFGFDGLR